MEDTRKHIIETAFHLFTQKSYKAVTMREIISETGLSSGAFYYYFENKVQLFKEVIDHYLLRAVKHVFENYPKNSLNDFIQHTLNNLGEIFDEFYKNTSPDASANFFSFMFEALRYFPDLQKEMLELQDLETNSWIEVIGIAKKNGEIRSDIPDDSIAKLFIYTSDGNRMDYVLDKDFDLLKSRIRTIWSDLYNMLRV
jgi:AcrR family transcriptional regulator